MVVHVRRISVLCFDARWMFYSFLLSHSLLSFSLFIRIFPWLPVSESNSTYILCLVAYEF